MRMLLATLCALTAGWIVAPPIDAAAPTACGGFVFDDLDGDGRYDTDETGVDDVVVTLTDRHGAKASTRTDSDGAWASTTGVSDMFPVRIEFRIPDTHREGPLGDDSGGSVQFHTGDDDCEVGLGTYVPGAACARGRSIVTGCYVAADHPDHDDQPAIQLMSPDISDNGADDAAGQGEWLSEIPTVLATNRDVGTIWGLATDHGGTVYAAGFVKRHTRLTSRLNPTGNPTAIYRIRPGGSAELFAVVDPDATDPHRGRDGAAPDARVDDDVFDDVYRSGLGDLEIDPDGTRLHTVDLGRRELVTLAVPSGEVERRLPITGRALGVDGCAVADDRPFGDLRAFGLGRDVAGRLLLGVVCSAESTVPADAVIDEDETPHTPLGDPGQLAAMVFEVDGDRFVERLRWDLAVDRGETQTNGLISNDATWHPWVDAVPFDDEHEAVSYPQPAVTDIAGLADGSIVLALGDRWGHQTMPGSNAPTTIGERHDIVEVISAGDLQLACPDGQNWAIEGAGECPGGWGDGFEHFTADRYGWHAETALGAVVALPDTGDDTPTIDGELPIVATHIDPRPGELTWWSGGIVIHDAATGTAVRGVRLYDGRYAEPDYTFEHAAGMAGLALLCDPVPAELGGRIWYDVDADGEQDPDEPPIAGVVVELRDLADTVLATTTTGADGAYRFGDEDVPGGLAVGDRHRITVAAWNHDGGPFGPGGAHTGLRLTDHDPSLDPAVDSDGTVWSEPGPLSALATAEAVVGDDPDTARFEGAVDHSIDFGYRDQYDLAVTTRSVRHDDLLGVLAFEIVVHNQGSEPSGAFAIVDRLPFGTELIAASEGADGGDDDHHDDDHHDDDHGDDHHDDHVLRWDYGVDDQLAAGETRTLTVLVLVEDPALSPFVNVAELVADDGDDDDSTPGNADLAMILDRTEELLESGGLLDDNGVDPLEDDADAAAVYLHQVQGRVWLDPDRDGEYRPDELADEPVVTIEVTERALAGVPVVLRHADGTEIDRQWTTYDGAYSFAMVPAGEYVIEIPRTEFLIDRPLNGLNELTTPTPRGSDEIGRGDGLRIPLGLAATPDAAASPVTTVDIGLATRPSRPWTAAIDLRLLVPAAVLLAVGLLAAQRRSNRAALLAG